MSVKSHLSRAVVGAAAAAMALVAAAAPAQAAELTLTYSCKYPLIGTQPVTVSFDRGSGDVSVPGSPQPITAKVSTGGSLAQGLNATGGFSTVGGQLALTLGLAIGDAPVEQKVVSLPFQEPRLAAPFSDPVVFTAVGPAIPISAPATVTIDALQPQIAFYNALGQRIDAPGLGPEPDIDGPDYGKRPWKPACTLNPGQNTAFPRGDVPIPLPFSVTAAPAQTSVELSWSIPTDGGEIAGYDIYNGSTKVATAAGNVAKTTISGLNPSSSYTFKVVARDAAGNSVREGSVTFTTKPSSPIPPPTIHYGYTLAGSTALKTLTKGTLPLKGKIDASLTIATGEYTADLTLNQTQGQLTALGFLPVTAKIGFVPSGKTTGKLADGVLTSSSKVRIKVQEVKLFGAIPLAGGNNCQTKSLSDINLKSTDVEFAPTVGGTLAGTYAISDLNGCGALNGLVSPLTAGAGNTISLKLTPAA